MLTSLLLSACLGLTVDQQQLRVSIDPPNHAITLVSQISATGPGPLTLLLSERMTLDAIRIDGRETPVPQRSSQGGASRITLELPEGTVVVELNGHGRFEEDIEAGERPGQIHNFSVDAHVGPQGVFLSDGSAWHPRPLRDDGRPILHPISLDIQPLEGWAFVASGDPTDNGPLTTPRWRWRSPRPLDGVALVGNRHVLNGVLHETKEGAVEIVMHVPAEHAGVAEMYLKAATSYLDLYVPKLGRFPYRRFSIVENFFSSGFAYPGFTLLGPQVVAMAPRSLAPGYLDHELLHNWWGNGVYVSPDDGNWCEALTSYGANYWRRVAEGGADAGRAYRRDLVMKLSTDPAGLDDGPLGEFGSANPASPGPDRFVGYDKGAFVFFMLEEVLARAAGGSGGDGGDALWASLRRFAELRIGGYGSWADIQAACEATAPGRPAGWLDGFFGHWVRQRSAPSTVVEGASDPLLAFARQIPESTGQIIDVACGGGGTWGEIDPDFRIYRVLPPEQLVPTVAGTTGPGGLRVETMETRPEVGSYVPQLESSDGGENLVIIGEAAIDKHASLLARTSDPITVRDGTFTVGGVTWEGTDQAVLHTMHHPERPGRYITVFHANGDTGWSRLRMIRFYSRDTTIVWKGDQVATRRTFEPDRRMSLSND